MTNIEIAEEIIKELGDNFSPEELFEAITTALQDQLTEVKEVFNVECRLSSNTRCRDKTCWHSEALDKLSKGEDL